MCRWFCHDDEAEYLRRIEDAFGARRDDYLQSDLVTNLKRMVNITSSIHRLFIISNKQFVGGIMISSRLILLSWIKKHLIVNDASFYLGIPFESS